MEAVNINVILIAGGLALLILIFGIYLVMETFGGPRKITKDRLTKMKGRFSGSKKENDHARAIRSLKGSGAAENALLSLLPRKEAIEKRLSRAGYATDINRYALVIGGLSLLILMLGLLAGAKFGLAILTAIALGAGLPHMWVGRAINKRREKFIKQFPEALDLMVRGLKSGLPVNECIINVSKEVTAPTGTEFTRVSDEMKLGKTLEDALWEASDRLEINDFKFFVISLSVQRETGGNLGETLENLSKILRSRQGMKLKIRAMSSEAKASAWIVGVLPFLMLGLIMTLNYDYGIILFTHPKAIMAGIGGLLWMALGIFVMKQMINFEV
ncbi:type II secretion system F family protein [Temperatibacter marinus]|uniref:Type II secretion system F family protein n=1 Tax=Temperatibacter marinus TaxID=1456591 RepID=A0AA52HAE1_9PROT|nr:type II secretion system F family protein [Temperatibacter marinus]WND02645.1 type II secretion system F family protein [Temperatibacter marinus]